MTPRTPSNAQSETPMLSQVGEDEEQLELSNVADKSVSWDFVKPLKLLILNYFDCKT